MKRLIGIIGIIFVMLAMTIIPASIYMDGFSIWSCIAGIVVLTFATALSALLLFLTKLASN